jgi:hypothetical protein
MDMRTDGAARMRAIAEEASVLVRKFKGAYSGEHGDGLCRGEWIEWQFGPALNEAFRSIKQKLDPINLFNPGKIIDPPKMDDASLFRFAPATAPKPYKRIPLTPVLDWSAWNVQADPVTEVTTAPGTGGDITGGFAKAVEMCNNNGHCRKFDAGTMCSSYRVTRDEQHLARGRANTLRLAVSGQLGPGAFTSEAMYETMDLCVGCKGCKRDCPTGVDMAKMKIEFLSHYEEARAHAQGQADRPAAGLRAMRASRVPWLLNLRNTVPGARWLGKRCWGSPRNARCPSGAATPSGAPAIFRCSAASRRSPPRAKVARLPFSSSTPSTAPSRARTRWLPARCSRRGWLHRCTRCKRGGHHCCGRTYRQWHGRRSQGQGRCADRCAAAPADAGIAIVGLEPSCLLTLRDETLVMGLGAKAQTVAGQACCSRNSSHVRRRPAASSCRSRRSTSRSSCTATATEGLRRGQSDLDVLKLIPGAKPG